MVVVFFSIALLTANSLVKLTQVIHFVVNQERIAAELCVERNEPISCCAGKCQLAKSVKAVENDMPDPIQGVKVVKTFDPFFILPASFGAIQHHRMTNQFYASNDYFVSSLFAKEIFHPPIV